MTFLGKNYFFSSSLFLFFLFLFFLFFFFLFFLFFFFLFSLFLFFFISSLCFLSSTSCGILHLFLSITNDLRATTKMSSCGSQHYAVSVREPRLFVVLHTLFLQTSRCHPSLSVVPVLTTVLNCSDMCTCDRDPESDLSGELTIIPWLKEKSSLCHPHNVLFRCLVVSVCSY